MATKPSTQEDENPESAARVRELPSRRDFLGTTAAIAAGSLAVGATTSGCSSVPTTRFPVGQTQDIPVGEKKLDEENNVFIVHSEEGFAAISAVCTHLSCIVDPAESGSGFACDCHGSRFAADGSVEEGPADEPLSWYEVTVDGGKLMVNGGKTVPAGTWVKG